MRLTRVKVAPLLSARLTRLRAHGQKYVRHCFSKKTKEVFAVDQETLVAVSLS